jgi:hypothetical protein
MEIRLLSETGGCQKQDIFPAILSSIKMPAGQNCFDQITLI